jgi:hypothetical protein
VDPQFDVFYKGVENYADILGPEGTEAYRKLAREAWAAIRGRTSSLSYAEEAKYRRVKEIVEELTPKNV